MSSSRGPATPTGPLPPSIAHLTQIKALAAEVEHFELRAVQSRVKLYRAMSAAKDGGVSVSDILKACGLSRQRVYKIIAGQQGDE